MAERLSSWAGDNIYFWSGGCEVARRPFFIFFYNFILGHLLSITVKNNGPFWFKFSGKMLLAIIFVMYKGYILFYQIRVLIFYICWCHTIFVFIKKEKRFSPSFEKYFRQHEGYEGVGNKSEVILLCDLIIDARVLIIVIFDTFRGLRMTVFYHRLPATIKGTFDLKTLYVFANKTPSPFDNCMVEKYLITEAGKPGDNSRLPLYWDLHQTFIDNAIIYFL